MTIFSIANRILEQFTRLFIGVLINHGLATDAREVMDAVSNGRLRGEEVVQTGARFRGGWQRVSVRGESFETLKCPVKTRRLTRQRAITRHQASSRSIIDGIAASGIVKVGPDRTIQDLHQHVRVVF